MTSSTRRPSHEESLTFDCGKLNPVCFSTDGAWSFGHLVEVYMGAHMGVHVEFHMDFDQDSHIDVLWSSMWTAIWNSIWNFM